MPAPRPRDMFDSDNPVEISSRFDAYTAELSKAISAPISAPGPFAQAAAADPMAQFQQSLGSDVITKAISAETVESIRTQLANADLVKDINLTNPLAGNLVAYDLEAPAKMLAPRPTPLRNRIARRKGVGTAHQFKRITGFTGSGSGGVANMRPGITESTVTRFGTPDNSAGPQYLRGPKISYAGDQVSVPYLQFGVSDQVSFAAQYSGMGYTDIQQLSQTSVLYSSMLLEERMILGGRGTASGFAGAVAAPSGTVTVAARTLVAGEAGLTGVTTNVYVKVTSESVWGESTVYATAGNGAATNGQVVDVTVANVPAGATGMRVYVGTGASQPADSALFYAGRTGSNKFVVQGAIPTSGRAISDVTADTTASAGDYDGLLTYCTGASSGYVKRLNGTLSTNPGNEFNVAFAAMYEANKADPSEVLMNGLDRKQLSDLIKTNSNTSGYRITVNNADEAHNATLGTLVSGLQNEVTGSFVDITVHPWLPQGNAPIVSWTLPMPDSNVSDVFAIYNVVDYQGIVWPTTQFAFETSSYWYGSMVAYAPGFCGAITGIQAA